MEQAKCKTTITVDLGFVEDVDYVLVDGVKSYNYTLEGNVLTVPHLTKFAKLLTVAAVDEHGKVTVQLYQLAYNDGYTAYRLLSNSDVVGTATKAVKTCVSTVKSLLGGLFKK